MLEVKSAGTRLRLHLTADLATIFLADEIIMVVNCPGADISETAMFPSPTTPL